MPELNEWWYFKAIGQPYLGKVLGKREKNYVVVLTSGDDHSIVSEDQFLCRYVPEPGFLENTWEFLKWLFTGILVLFVTYCVYHTLKDLYETF